jgi:hypothetical protein
MPSSIRFSPRSSYGYAASSGDFPARCYPPLINHLFSFDHIGAIMQINARTNMVRDDPEPVANSNSGVPQNGQVPVFFGEFFQF